MSSPPLGELIFIAIKPLIKLAIPVIASIFLTRRGLFTQAGARTCSHILLNITLPALLFSKIVPAFTPDNASSIGVLLLVGCFYQGISGVFGVLLRLFVPVPHNFRYGIIAASIWSNWGDLPTSVVQTVASSAPFKGQADADLAIAYVSIFILVFYVTLFPLRGQKLIEVDFTSKRSIDEEKKMASTPLADWVVVTARRNMPSRLALRRSDAKSDRSAPSSPRTDEKTNEDLVAADPLVNDFVGKESRHHPHDPTRQLALPPDDRASARSPQPASARDDASLQSRSSLHNPPSFAIRLLHSTRDFLISLCAPPTVALALALVIALVPTLKALFVKPAAGATFHPTAPDNNPPLSILLDTASFVGAASVPLGLLVLGNGIARMYVPRPLSKLPWTSIVLLAVFKCAVLPVIGVLFVNALVRAGLIREENKVLRFVAIYFSSVPTATTQMALSQIYKSDDPEANDVDYLSSYLLFQYFLMIPCSVVLMAYTLNMLF